MGSLLFWPSVRDPLLIGWFPNCAQISSLSRGSGAFAGFEGKAYSPASPVSAASEQSWQDLRIIHALFFGSLGNGPVQGSRLRGASSLGKAAAALSLSKKGTRGGISGWNCVAGNYTARSDPRYHSLPHKDCCSSEFHPFARLTRICIIEEFCDSSVRARVFYVPRIYAKLRSALQNVDHLLIIVRGRIETM